MIEIRQYTTPSGINVVDSWLESLRDDRTHARIAARLDRLAEGNFGDWKPVGGGVRELRIDFWSGVPRLLGHDWRYVCAASVRG